jgi:hypothetical protein
MNAIRSLWQIKISAPRPDFVYPWSTIAISPSDAFVNCDSNSSVPFALPVGQSSSNVPVSVTAIRMHLSAVSKDV